MSDFSVRRTTEYRQAMSASVKRARAKMTAAVNAERIKPTGEVMLSNGMTCWVDPEDIPLIRDRVWIAFKSHRTPNTYYARSSARPAVFMHVLLMGKREGHFVDHRDHDGLNNRRSNLRWATQSQNCVNTTKLARGSSGYRGVSRTRNGRFHAAIHVNKTCIGLGNHLTAEDAARAYDKAARQHFGEFARLNFPEAT